jgi:hypothetical protein
MDKRQSYVFMWRRRLETLCVEAGMMMIYEVRSDNGRERFKDINYPGSEDPEIKEREELMRSRQYVPWDCRLDRIIP